MQFAKCMCALMHLYVPLCRDTMIVNSRVNFRNVIVFFEGNSASQMCAGEFAVRRHNVYGFNGTFGNCNG